MTDKEIQDIIDDYEYHVQHGNTTAINRMIERTKGQTIDLADMLKLIHQFIYPLIMQSSFQAMELSKMRIKAVVDQLDEQDQKRIYEQLEEMGDTLEEEED